jgi:hypothetical protein
MTKIIACSLFYATAVLLKNYRIPFACLRLFFLNLSCPTNQPNQLRYSHTRFNFLSTVPCLLYTLSISNFFICATQCYRVMSVVGLNKDSTPSLIPISVHIFSRQYSGQHLGCQDIIEQKVREILIGYLEIFFYLVVMYH